MKVSDKAMMANLAGAPTAWGGILQGDVAIVQRDQLRADLKLRLDVDLGLRDSQRGQLKTAKKGEIYARASNFCLRFPPFSFIASGFKYLIFTQAKKGV